MASARVFPLKNGISVIIREAEVKDAEGIINTINSVGAEKVFIFTERFSHDVEWEQAFIQEHVKEKKDYLLAVAEVNGKIVGVCYVHQGSSPKDSHVAELGLNVIKSFRKTGIGTAMMIYMIDWAKNRGARKLCLGVFSTNQQAINLYKKFNFRVEGTRKKQYKINGKYVDEVIMGRFLEQ
jgi:RimJ/RimL family protein N-acetyltransferase